MKKWTERMKNLIINIDDMQIPVYAANACYFLGSLYYDRFRYNEAAECFEACIRFFCFPL